MLSLILPYFDRQEAANAALEQLATTYPYLDLEVIVVDDGGGFVCPPVSLNIKVVTLPTKSEPKCPTTAWNEGVKASSGEIIVLSCVEILHKTPVLAEMEQAVKRLGPKGYVLAAAWCPEQAGWHCHSTVRVPDCPKGVGIAFCGAMHRDLFFEAGGFDEDYREGAGYEDRDFIKRMLKVKAQFELRDDLVVVHPKTGATTNWGSGKFERNEALFYAKWKHQVSFVCLNAGNYAGRGVEYVNNLYDMVGRNTSVPFRFFCLTDNPEGLDTGIEPVELPSDLEGWWGKLYLFKEGLFEGRMIFLDLDTVITSHLDDIVKYGGDMAILRDFYHDRGAPGVILWRAGFGSNIWNDWVEAGRPRNDLGDLGWIEQLDEGRFTKSIDRLQDLFPGRFVSYKAHCSLALPKGASVVCFHGFPRPHEVEDEWVKRMWCKGGVRASEIEMLCNTKLEQVKANIAASSLRDIPWLDIKPETGRDILLIGGGPSLLDSVEEIRDRQKTGALICSMNGTADFLGDHGITPDWQIIIDARPENLRFVKSRVAEKHFLASQCDPSLFDHVKATLFHIAIEDWHTYFGETDKPVHAIGGGHSVGLYAMSLAYTQGFRSMHLFGYDSSYAKDSHHAYQQAENNGEAVIDAIVGGRKFKAAPWMVTQVNQFQELANQLRALGCTIQTHGTGLLPHVAWMMMAA